MPAHKRGRPRSLVTIRGLRTECVPSLRSFPWALSAHRTAKMQAPQSGPISSPTGSARPRDKRAIKFRALLPPCIPGPKRYRASPGQGRVCSRSIGLASRRSVQAVAPKKATGDAISGRGAGANGPKGNEYAGVKSVSALAGSYRTGNAHIGRRKGGRYGPKTEAMRPTHPPAR